MSVDEFLKLASQKRLEFVDTLKVCSHCCRGIGYHGDVNTKELVQATPLTRAQVDNITDIVHAAPQWYPGSTKEIRVCYHYPLALVLHCDDCYRILLWVTRKLRRKLRP